MRNVIIIAVAWSLIAASGQTAKAEETETQAKPETYLIVKHFDRAKKMTYKMLSQSEYKAVQDEIANETKLWDKAMSAAEKAWKADTSTAKKSFPKGAISPLKAIVSDRFNDQTKASEKLASLEKSMAATEEAQKKREEDQKKKNFEPLNKVLNRKNPADDKGDAVREAYLNNARSLFESKLTEVASGTTEKQ